jgi:MFS family permease
MASQEQRRGGAAKPSPLSPKRLGQARKSYYTFNFLNSFSFVFLSGSFVTLFAIRMGASNALVGVLNAIAYATFFMMPIGKKIVRKKPIVWTFGWAWVGRYTAFIPTLMAPLFAARGMNGVALGLLIVGVAGFGFFRGIALIGNNPVVGFLATGGGEKPRSDRGEFMTNTSIINSLASMTSGLMVALFLGENATPWSYALGVCIGIGSGYLGCYFLLKTPEPTNYNPGSGSSLLETTKEAVKDPTFRRFIFLFMALSFISGMGRSFLPVYAKDVFSQGDDAVMVYALLSSMGSVAMGLLSRLVVDRLGSKPLFIIFSSIGLVSFLPMALIPGTSTFFSSSAVTALFLAGVHFISAFGFAGEENAGQTYYFSLVPKEKTMDLSVIYYFAFGLGGSLGSGFGGLLLDGFGALGYSHTASYRLFYGFLCLLLGVSIYFMQALRRLGSASVTQSLGVMFSLRDLRAFDLLMRLDRSANPKQEVKLIQELGRSASLLSQEELLDYLRSPRFQVRMEALRAFETMSHLSQKVIRYLLKEVETHSFTTSYVAARILGKHGTAEAIPTLRRSLEVEDYMLQGSVMISLAQLGDEESIPLIESILMKSKNPRVKISAAYALEVLKSKNSLPALVSSLKNDDPPAFVSDEIVIAMASIMEISKDFYPLYSAFMEDENDGVSQLRSTASDIIVDNRTLEQWQKDVETLFGEEGGSGKGMAGFIVRTGTDPQTELVLSEALLDPDLHYKGLKFLAAAYPLFVKRRITEA